MTLSFDRQNYCNLRVEVAPTVIETEAEYDRLLAIAEQLIFAQNRTLEQKQSLKLITIIIEQYELENYSLEE